MDNKIFIMLFAFTDIVILIWIFNLLLKIPGNRKILKRYGKSDKKTTINILIKQICFIFFITIVLNIIILKFAL